MRTEIRFHGVDRSESLSQFTMRLANAQLLRFEHELSSVAVRVTDVNGPKGGVDKRCRVTVRGPRVGISVDETSADAYRAVDSTIARAARAVGRKIDRARARRMVEVGRRKPQ